MNADFYADPFNGEGALLSETPLCRNWICKDKDNPDLWHQCAVEWTDPLYEMNNTIRNDTSGQKFGSFRHVASTPMNVYFDKVLPAKLNGDQRWQKQFIANNRQFQTFDKL